MLTKNLSVGYKSDVSLSDIVKYGSADDSYSELVCDFSDGGYFYNKSLHLYGYNSMHPDFHNIFSVNQSLKENYNEAFQGLFSFGEDIFGNQFTFSEYGIFFLILKQEIEKDFVIHS